MPWQTFPALTRRQIAEFRAIRRCRAKFLVDENLGPRVVRLLRASGWNAKGTEDFGLNGHCDREVFAAARRHNRLLLTQDHDFLDDKRFPPHLNPGLVVLPAAEGNRQLILTVVNDVLRKQCQKAGGYKGVLAYHAHREASVTNAESAVRKGKDGYLISLKDDPKQYFFRWIAVRYGDDPGTVPQSKMVKLNAETQADRTSMAAIPLPLVVPE